MKPILGVVVLMLASSLAQQPATQQKEEPKPQAPAADQTVLSPDFKEAGINAADAIGRLPDISSAGDGYEARALDADKALDVAKHKVKTDRDKEAYKVLVAWWATVGRSHDASEAHRMDRFKRSSEVSLYCLAESKVTFDPDSMSEAGKKLAAEKKCLSEYKKLAEETTAK